MTDTEDFEFPGDIDLEKLRSELIELSEKGEIKHTKVFLNNKKKCTESVMKQIMAEYVEKREKESKAEFAVAFVTLVPSFAEKTGYVHFKGGHASFSSKVLADENTMFVLSDLMPVCEGGGYYFKYFSAVIFLSALCSSNISFGFKEPDVVVPDTTHPETTEKKETTPREAQ